MNRTASRPSLSPVPFALLGIVFPLIFPPHAVAEVPRLPFAGVQGATAGAGSLTGWDRHGGDNPAVLGPPGYAASIAGYSPFGLEGLRVMEGDAAWDAATWGAAMGVRALFHEEGSGAAVWNIRSAWRPREGLSTGGSLRYAAREGAGLGGGLGILWHPQGALSLGVAWEGEALRTAARGRAGFGADAGSRFGNGHAWRIAVECFSDADREAKGWRRGEWRFGAGFRFHALLSVYAGLAPGRETAGLGVRFGMGDWEGYSALRRHAALGGTSIQGLRWRREGKSDRTGYPHQENPIRKPHRDVATPNRNEPPGAPAN
jgi:hypothetical protein